ncbi:hypothetical protein SVXHr_1957 [Halorhabdus sp. SVX81]|nr:hypothetical protein SVXHr_1957 [Halorhabdus sp. SVX81]
MITGEKARIVHNIDTSSQDRYVDGQPTLQSAPAANGWLANRPAWFDEHIKWDHVEAKNSIRQMQDRFDPDQMFATVIASANLVHYELTDYRKPKIEDGTIQFYVKPGCVSCGNSEIPDEPKYSYGYTFILWKRHDGVDPLTDLVLNYKGGELDMGDAANGSDTNDT